MAEERRVQIVPFGYEYARVKRPLFEKYADKIVLLRHLEAEDYPAEFQEDLIKELESNPRFDLEIRRCDLFDISSSRQTIQRAIRDHPDDQVSVNLSTGTKLTAIAGMMACQLEDAAPFYVRPEFRNEAGVLEAPTEPVVGTVDDAEQLELTIDDIEVFPMSGPSPEQVEILAYLDRVDGATKKELIQFSIDQSLPYITGTDSTSKEARYRRLDTHIISPLEREGYLELEKAGRTKVARLTPAGESVVHVFYIE